MNMNVSNDININKLKSNVWKMYAYWFFHNLIFAYVIERLFYAQRSITIKQVVYLEIVYAAVVVLLEVPSGALADSWSRKNMMVLSSVFCFLEFFILIFAHSFWQFVMATFVAGVCKILSSGTSNAIIYDSLRLVGEEDRFEEVLGKNNFFDNFSGMIAALVGSFIAAKRGYVSVYWLSLVSVFISFIISLTFVEPIIKSSTEENKYLDYIKESFSFIRNQSSLKFIIIFGVIIAACVTYVDEFWQIYLKEIQISVIYFGIFSGISALIRSVSGIWSYKIKKRFNYKTIFSFLILLFSVAIIGCSYVTNKFGVIIIFLIYIASGITEPLISGYLHHRTESENRATVESFQSLISRIFIIIIGLIFGEFSTRYSIFIGFRVLGIVALVYAIYYLMFQFKYIEK